MDALILSLSPHMHLRGKAAEYELIHAGRFLPRREILLRVPRYDFSWQHVYTFRKPVFAPKGSKIRFTARWDNSAANPTNPDPTVPVRWGLRTKNDEMGNGWMLWAPAESRPLVVE